MRLPMQFGAYTFVETRRDPLTGEPVDVNTRLADVLEQISSPTASASTCSALASITAGLRRLAAAVALAAAAARTKRIRLTSAVTVLRRTIR